MIILDKPYVSQLLKETAATMNIPVLNNCDDSDFIKSGDVNLTSEEEFLKTALDKNPLKLYCNSENSINWITSKLKHTKLPEYIELCKDKVKFREMIKPLYPDFYFKEVEFKELDKLDISSVKKPFIIKPSVGFFSMGVHKVSNDTEWESVQNNLKEEIKSVEGLYPETVMNSSKFIIEECIDGEEYAIDAYYNSNGKPVILNILKHPFSSEYDVSDRVYYTSKEIILENLKTFGDLLEKIGSISSFSNFPVHVEVRVDTNGKVTPIEFNPMRFAGWCVTDIAYFAYGINTYEYYFEETEPLWDEILSEKEGKIYSLVLVDLPSGLDVEDIEGFDFESFVKRFDKILELRKIDFRKYPVFALMFIETSERLNELDMVLKMDYNQYIK